MDNSHTTINSFARTDGRMENNVTLAHCNHEGKWCSKFGLIPPSGLGGDSVADRRRTDEKIRLLSHTLNLRGSDVASLVEFRPVI